MSEVGELLLGHGEKYNEWSWGDWFDASEENVTGLGTVKVVETFGGEGLGDSAHMVFEVVAGEHQGFYRLNGYYSSYQGFDWDGRLHKVEAVQKTITVYE